MPRGNIDNLKPPSTDEARNRGQKGGIASGQSRRERKLIQEALQRALSGNYGIVDDNGKNKKVVGYDALALSMIQQAIGGNVKAATFIRDTVGEKPTETVNFESDTLTGIKINFVDKSNKNTNKEKDPKIVGEYTPPSNSEEVK